MQTNDLIIIPIEDYNIYYNSTNKVMNNMQWFKAYQTPLSHILRSLINLISMIYNNHKYHSESRLNYNLALIFPLSAHTAAEGTNQ